VKFPLGTVGDVVGVLSRNLKGVAWLCLLGDAAERASKRLKRSLWSTSDDNTSTSIRSFA
jgi:hypothetical protein